MSKEKLTLENVLVPKEEIPYEVPENWCWVKLGGLTNVKSSKRILAKEYQESGIPFYRSKEIVRLSANKEITDNIYITEERYKEIKTKFGVPKAGDLLITCVGTIGETWIVDDREFYYKDGNIVQIDKNEYINTRYIELVIKSTYFNSWVNSTVSGSAYSALTIDKLKQLPIPLPPLAEQVRIIKRIESLFDKVDKAKELVEEARDGFKKRRSAILERAFNGELTKKWREENGVGDECNEKKLKDICKLTSGGTPSRTNEEYYTGNIPWIKTGEIKWNDIYDSEEHITEDAIKNSSAKLIPENTILVAMYGQGLTRGRAGILRKTSSTNQAVCALIPTDEINYEFLYYYFMKNYWKFREAAKGGNQENLSGKVIGQFSIELPSLKEQLEIVRVLKKLLDKENNIDDVTEIRDTIDVIKKSILAKAFRGEIGSNDLNEESSIELIKN